MTTFTDRLKQAMSMRHMRQKDLFEKTGIPRGTISNYVLGKYKPKFEVIETLANALNVSPIWLNGADVPMEKSEGYDAYYESIRRHGYMNDDQKLSERDLLGRQALRFIGYDVVFGDGDTVHIHTKYASFPIARKYFDNYVDALIKTARDQSSVLLDIWSSVFKNPHLSIDEAREYLGKDFEFGKFEDDDNE